MIGSGRSGVTFGTVTAKRPRVPAVETQRNIEQGRSAFAAAKEVLLKTGVALRARKGVALYRADPVDPQLLVRELDGVQQRGRLVGGHFEAV